MDRTREQWASWLRQVVASWPGDANLLRDADIILKALDDAKKGERERAAQIAEMNGSGDYAIAKAIRAMSQEG